MSRLRVISQLLAQRLLCAATTLGELRCKIDLQVRGVLTFGAASVVALRIQKVEF